ncbi:SWI/SNF and RSC complex subunit Ssr3 [Saguinus oedipus]|uniref:Translocon-associated protein subunit gamma n=1 Tax=Saguinus oedipus TaxID=9490 RepID=A0ABQ9UPK0_SAGOE|nr:SWI/SNF and RSC complex subunit Ssr3 [Saguinus oedipus]
MDTAAAGADPGPFARRGGRLYLPYSRLPLRQGSQRQFQTVVRGGPAPAGFQPQRLVQVLRALLGNAFIVSAIPIWLYWRIRHMDLIQSSVLYSVMTLVSTYLVAFAYRNVKFVLNPKVAQKREDAVSKEVIRKLSEADNRKMSRKEKDERILWKKNEVADYEATTFSIFYNSTLLFLVLVSVASFFILKNFNPTVNYILSISASSGLLAQVDHVSLRPGFVSMGGLWYMEK